MKYFQNKYDYIFLSLGILVLGITLFFPVSSDISAFIQGGIALKNGGELYVDYFDVKPPFVYYIYEFLYTLFGKTIELYRAFDIAYQIVFLLSSIYIFGKLGYDKNAIRLFSILVPIAYVTLDYASNSQVENLLFLPLIWYYYLSSKAHRSKLDILIKGILLGVAINLKYTFGIILVADILYMIVQKRDVRQIFVQSIMQLVVALFVTLVLFSPIILSGNFDAFIKFFNYMRAYSNFPPMTGSLILYIIKAGTSFFTDNFSIVLFLAAIYAVYYTSVMADKSDKALPTKGLVIFSLVLFCSVVIERKLLHYHEMRTYPFLLMLSSIGLVFIATELSKYKKTTILIILSIAIIFSPATRLFKAFKYPIGVITKGKEAYYSNLFVPNLGYLIRNQYQVADYINKYAKTDKVLVMSTGAVETLFYFRFDYKYSFPQSAFYLTEKAPKYLKYQALKDIKDAMVIVLQNNDKSQIMFFNDDTSLSALKRNKAMWDYVSRNFAQDTVIDNNFIVFKRTMHVN